MRATPLSAAAVCMLLWLGPAGRASAQDRDPDAKIAGGGTLPAGWHARTDKNRPLADAKIQTMGTGLHTTLGPPVILWRGPGPGAGNQPPPPPAPPNPETPPPQGGGTFVW